MAGVLEICCAVVLGLPLPALATASAPPKGQSQDEAEAKALYEQGRTAYRLGKFEDAIDKWERAYAKAELPLFLFNIALAHRKLYDLNQSITHLRASKAVLESFLILAAEDPELDSSEGQRLMEEIEQQLATAEADGGTEGGGTEGGGTQSADTGGEPVTTPTPADPRYKRSRVVGGVLMGTGGAMVVAGSVLGVLYGLQARSWNEALARATDEDAAAREDFMQQVGDPSANPMAYDEFSRGRCSLSDGRTAAAFPCRGVITLFEDNQRGATTVMGVGIGLAGLGVAGVVAGAVIYAKARPTDAPATARRSIHVSPSGLGLQLFGRF